MDFKNDAARPTLRGDKYCPALNLFRHKLTSNLLCAVPEDYPVPGFLDASTWEFAGKMSERSTALPDFNDKAAQVSVRFNGFYLFEASLIEHCRTTIGPQGEQVCAPCDPSWMAGQSVRSGLAETKGSERPELRAG